MYKSSPSPADQVVWRIRKIVISALLIASQVVLARFLAVQTPILTVSFSFVPLFLAGMILGWRSSLVIAIISDLIGALLFPVGAFFPGYTLTTALTGLIAGLTLYNPHGIKVDRRFMLRLLLCTAIVSGALNGGLNTLWIMVTTGGASHIIVPVRLAKQLIMLPIQFLTMFALAKIFSKHINQLFFSKANAPEEKVSKPGLVTEA